MINNSINWSLSPAYDLLNVTIVNPAGTEELALTSEAKKKKIRLEHFIRFGHGLGLTQKQIDGVLKRFDRKKKIAIDWISNSFLPEEYKQKYLDLLFERYSRIIETV